MRTVRLFMNVYARTTRAGETRYHAEWWTRGTTCLMYRSIACDTGERAAELARKWLERMNRPPATLDAHARAWHERTVQYVDTTPQPERFGYSHEVQS